MQQIKTSSPFPLLCSNPFKEWNDTWSIKQHKQAHLYFR